jgi:hypothetical protein
MVAARITRQSFEVVSAESTSARVSRLDAEIATKATEATTAVRARISRQSIEVVSVEPAKAMVSRLDAEIATLAAGPTTAVRAFITRQSIEVVTNEVQRARVSRLDAEVATLAAQPTAAVRARITRISFEIVARESLLPYVIPLPLAAGHEIFLHNWVTALRLRSSYSTDISQSATNGSEARRALLAKPTRTMDLVWELEEQSRMDRLLVMLRKLTNERIAIPLYCDQKELDRDYLSTEDTLFFDTTQGRWFLGQRIAIVATDYRGSYLSHSLFLITDKQSDRLVLDNILGANLRASTTIILPMIDCEVVLRASMKKQKDCHGRVEMSVREVFGPSQLPPLHSDIPVDAQTFNGIPIFTVEPDWIEGVEVGRDRQGREYQVGRTMRVSIQAARSRQTHSFSLTGNRDDMWPIVEFFDTRMGRLRTFWLTDQEFIWDIAAFDVSGAFVSVFELGDFADFQAEFEGGWIGIVMKDGTVYVREAVTIQQILTVFRITVDPVLPGSLDINDVDHIARARVTRFESDELTEEWSHLCYMRTQLDFLEALEEAQAEI